MRCQQVLARQTIIMQVTISLTPASIVVGAEDLQRDLPAPLHDAVGAPRLIAVTALVALVDGSKRRELVPSQQAGLSAAGVVGEAFLQQAAARTRLWRGDVPRAVTTAPLPRHGLLSALSLSPLDDLPLVVVEIELAVRFVLVDFVQTLAAVIHAVCRVGTVAARPELGSGGVDTVAQDGAVYEGEVGRQHSTIARVVDDGDGESLVGFEGADLAPVTALSLVCRDLQMVRRVILSLGYIRTAFKVQTYVLILAMIEEVALDKCLHLGSERLHNVEICAHARRRTNVIDLKIAGFVGGKRQR